jgi:hypothetical protein
VYIFSKEILVIYIVCLFFFSYFFIIFYLFLISKKALFVCLFVLFCFFFTHENSLFPIKKHSLPTFSDKSLSSLFPLPHRRSTTRDHEHQALLTTSHPHLRRRDTLHQNPQISKPQPTVKIRLPFLPLTTKRTGFICLSLLYFSLQNYVMLWNNSCGY